MTGGRIHAVAWLAWVLSAAACIELAPNPLYVALVIAAAAAAAAGHRTDSSLARAFPVLLGVGVVFALVRVVLTALTSRGSGAVLFTTPSFTVPDALGGFSVGGPIDSSIVVGAAAGSFAIVGMMAAFGAFNAVVSHHELVHAAPGAFYEAGLVLTVSLAFVPSIITTAQLAREADRARLGGARPPRRRAFRLAVPVLESALERSLALAESMDSRGFGRDRSTRYDRAAALAALGAVLGLAAAFVALVGGRVAVAAAAGGAAVAALAGAVVLASRATARVRHRRRRLGPADAAVIGSGIIAAASVALARAAGVDSMTWADSSTWPGFDVAVAVPLMLLAVPALIAPAPALRPHRETAADSAGAADAAPAWP